MVSFPSAALSLAAAAADVAAAAPAPGRLDLGGSASSLGGAATAVALLAALAGAALFLSQRRRRPRGRHVEIVETTSLGPRRALVVARVGGELVLLAASEAGIALLPHRLDPRAAAEPLAPPARPSLAVAGEEDGFDALLHESAEDQELRAKLARGLSGSVR